jgi:hypothetical protein
MKRLAAVTWLPEFNVAVFALLLNYPWEFLQAPVFDRMADASHWQATIACSLATVGDAVIMLVAYWVVSAYYGDRGWIIVPRTAQIALFVAVGATVTVAIERLVLEGQWIHEWRYSPSMPVLPGIGVGLSPVLQWLLLPPLVIWFARHQGAAPRG